MANPIVYGKLCNPIKVAYGSTVGVITCVDNKKIYIDGVYAHAGYGASTSAQIYFVPNGERLILLILELLMKTLLIEETIDLMSMLLL